MNAGVAGFVLSMVAGAFSGVVADRVWSAWRDYHLQRPERQYLRFRRALDDSDAFAAVTSVLCEMYCSGDYQDQVLRMASGTYPCLVFPAEDDDPEKLLGELDTSATTVGDVAARDTAYRVAVDSSSDVPTHDRSVFALTGLSPEGPRLECRLVEEGYRAVLDTCLGLEYEAFLAVRRRSPDAACRVDASSMLMRQAANQAAGDPVLSGVGRIASIGGSTVTVYKDGRGEYRVIVPQRSDSGVSTARGLFAVAPSFSLAAQFGDTTTEYSVSFNVMREYCEELLGVPEWGSADPEAVKKHPEYLRLEQMLVEGSAAHVSLGVSFNLLDLRADVCTLLVIHDCGWAASLRLSDEYTTHRQFLNTPLVADLMASWDEHRLPYAPHEIAPSCAGALCLALRRLQAEPELMTKGRAQQ